MACAARRARRAPQPSALEKHRHASEHLAFVEWFQGARPWRLFRRQRQLLVAVAEILDRGVEREPAVVDENHVGEQILHLLDLMSGEQDVRSLSK